MKMQIVIPISNWIIPFTVFLCAIHQSLSYKQFLCANNKGDAVPDLPQAYSTNVRLNFGLDLYSAEVISYVNQKEQKELIEFKTAQRRVKYIRRGDLKTLLVITYQKDERPKCNVKQIMTGSGLLQTEDVGPREIVAKTAEAILQQTKFSSSGGEMENGVLVQSWEACFTDPRINVSLSFAASHWTQSHVSSLAQTARYPVQIEAQIGDTYMTAQYSKFDPSVPDDALFQPPADVYCEGFRSDKSPPSIPDYFSYDAEIIVYESAEGIAPIVSSRKVYYDYPSGISRTDFYDPLSKTSDLFSPITAQEKSVIHDFNAGIQYSFDPFTGKCTQDSFKSTFSVISSQETKSGEMLKGQEYFWMDNTKFSYNGQFPVRGLMADVFTAITTDPQTQKKKFVTWYFSTEETRVVETENVEKNILLRMTVRPETDLGKEGLILINLYNFARDEPSVGKYDLTSCYNESYSKLLVLTFPGNDLLQDYEKLIGVLVHLAITDATGISKQRIFVKEVVFIGKYMYAEFDVLEAPSGPLSKSKETSLDDAMKKLEKSISSANFTVRIPVGKQTIVLRPEPNGLNVFSGDRIRVPSVIGYNEGSVISLTIGMLILGLLLGIVTLNLIMSRKFGVSLFQKSTYGNAPFSNTLNESSM